MKWIEKLTKDDWATEKIMDKINEIIDEKSKVI